MQARIRIISLIVWVALGLIGCSTQAKPTVVVPSVEVPTVVIPTVVIPTVIVPNVVVPTLSVPTVVPTVAASSSSSSASAVSSASAATNPIQAAIAKTRAATIFQAHEEMTFGQAFGSTRDNNTLIRLDGDFNGTDAHIKVGGGMIAFFGLEPTNTLEFIQVSNKTYVHGPAAGIGAPENKWYVLGANSGINSTPNPFDTLDELMKQKVDLTKLKLVRTTTDALACNFYQADKDVAASVWTGAIFSATGVAPVVDDGTMEISVCKDGYMHDWTINLSGHDSKNPGTKGTALFRYGFTNFDTKVAIIAPTDAIPSVTPTGGLMGLFDATATPTPRAVENGPSSSSSSILSTTVNGEWKGTTDADSTVSFTVSNNQVTFASLNLIGRSGGCSGSTSIGKSISDTPVINNSFNTILTMSDGTQITFAGTFSAGQFKGTLTATGKLPCDVTEIKNTWSAQNTSVATAPTKAAPTATKSASSSSASSSSRASSSSSAAGTDPASIVNSFFGAINAKNLDAAMNFVDNDPIYTWGSSTGMDKASLKGLLATQSVTYTPSNFQVIGTIVKFTLTASDGKTYSSSQAILNNGKIALLTIK